MVLVMLVCSSGESVVVATGDSTASLSPVVVVFAVAVFVVVVGVFPGDVLPISVSVRASVSTNVVFSSEVVLKAFQGISSQTEEYRKRKALETEGSRERKTLKTDRGRQLERTLKTDRGRQTDEGIGDRWRPNQTQERTRHEETEEDKDRTKQKKGGRHKGTE